MTLLFSDFCAADTHCNRDHVTHCLVSDGKLVAGFRLPDRRAVVAYCRFRRLLAVGIALLDRQLFKSLKAALMNPVKSLKTE